MHAPLKSFFYNTFLVLATVSVVALMSEGLLRLKNSDQKNYNIEMWRYARELKQISPDVRLGHVHVPNRDAMLQNVAVRINSLGMRGPEPQLGTGKRRILLLGGSITLGWGVDEQKTMASLLQGLLGPGFEVMNGGVGNYNAARTVSLFESQWRNRVKPDLVIFPFFLRDGERLAPSKENILIRNSELAVTLLAMIGKIQQGTSDMTSLVEHYRSVYNPESPDAREALAALEDLNRMAKEDGFKVVLASVPDIHQLKNYPFQYVHELLRGRASSLGWGYVDFMDDFKKFEGPELWTIPGDPHPNAEAHRIMAERLAAFLRPAF